MSTAPTIVSAKRTLRSEVNPSANNLIAMGILTEEKLDTESAKLPTQGASDLVASVAGQPTFVLDMNEVGVTIARWEGVVESVDEVARTMTVTLRSKGGTEPEHTAELMLSEVGEDDQDLIEPGAVFYIEQTRRHVRKTMTLIQTLSFRRLPAWSKRTVDMNVEKGAVIRARFKQATYAAE